MGIPTSITSFIYLGARGVQVNVEEYGLGSSSVEVQVTSQSPSISPKPLQEKPDPSKNKLPTMKMQLQLTPLQVPSKEKPASSSDQMQPSSHRALATIPAHPTGTEFQTSLRPGRAQSISAQIVPPLPNTPTHMEIMENAWGPASAPRDTHSVALDSATPTSPRS